MTYIDSEPETVLVGVLGIIRVELPAAHAIYPVSAHWLVTSAYRRKRDNYMLDKRVPIQRGPRRLKVVG